MGGAPAASLPLRAGLSLPDPAGPGQYAMTAGDVVARPGCLVCWHTMRRTTIKLPDELDVRLRHEAARRRVTISTVTREAIEEHLQAGGRLAGGRSWHSGASDVSERVDEILQREFSR